MICQPNNWNMLKMLEKLSAQAIYYRPWSDGLTGISNTVNIRWWIYVWALGICDWKCYRGRKSEQRVSRDPVKFLEFSQTRGQFVLDLLLVHRKMVTDQGGLRAGLLCANVFREENSFDNACLLNLRTHCVKSYYLMSLQTSQAAITSSEIKAANAKCQVGG